MKIVLLSGYREFEYAREAIRCQVYEYLLKPIDYEKLRHVFAQIKMELDETYREETLLKSFGEGEYDQVLNLIKAVAGSVMGEGEETWLAYARLRPMMLSAPQSVREVLAKRLLEQLREELQLKAPKLDEEFELKLKALQPADSENFHEQLCSVLCWLNDKLVSGNLVTTQKQAVDDCITKACKYINNHLGEDFTYRDVAEFVHLSPRHFIRRFRNEMNETFTDYLVRVRIEGAMRLMDEEQTDAADVSFQVGYRDDKYFQQLFKKRVGCTPREYQRGKQKI